MHIYVIHRVENHRDREVDVVSAHKDKGFADRRAWDLDESPQNRSESGHVQYWHFVTQVELED